jgi:hypothetical protein
MRYVPELLMGLMVTAQNIALIVASAWATVKLYGMSRSWHCLWVWLFGVLSLARYTFTRD